MYFTHDYKGSCLWVILDLNWLETPLFDYNKNKVLRIDLKLKNKDEILNIMNSILEDIFYAESDMFLFVYGSSNIDLNVVKQTFNKLSLKKIVKRKFDSKDPINKNKKKWVSVFKTQKKFFDTKKYIEEFYLKGQDNLIINSLKKGVSINVYRNGEINILSTDKVFLRRLFEKYKMHITEKNSIEMEKVLFDDSVVIYELTDHLIEQRINRK